MNTSYYTDNDTAKKNEKAYEQARRQVQAKLGFQQHLIAYVLGAVLLVGIYLLTQVMPGFPEYPWFIWPLAGWGVALVAHFLEVFVFSEIRSEAHHNRMIEHEMRRIVRK